MTHLVEGELGTSKIFVLDTSVLIDDPDAMEKFGDNVVVVPAAVIGELDSIKNEHSGRGQAARRAGRIIDHYTECGAASNGGIRTPGGGLLFVTRQTVNMRKARLSDTGDGHIIGTALYVKLGEEKKKSPDGRPVVLVSKDVLMRSTARVAGLIAQEYTNPRKVASLDELTDGVARFNIYGDEHELMRLFHQTTQVPAEIVFDAIGGEQDLFPNTCCIFERTEGQHKATVLAVYKKKRGVFVHVPYKAGCEKEKGLYPRTWEQAFALHLVRDPEISLVALCGPAGTGKTLMPLFVGYEAVMAEPRFYRQMIIYRPTVEAGEKVGAVPGPLSAKFAEFMVPITDNLAVIIDAQNGYHEAGSSVPDQPPRNRRERRRSEHKNTYNDRRGSDDLRDTIDFLITDGPIEISPINFARGRSLNDTFVILDEAQNLKRTQAKLVVTRAGRRAKVVITGDPSQIDLPYLDEVTNGLSHTVATMRGEEIFAHLTMRIAVRSELAEIAGRKM